MTAIDRPAALNRLQDAHTTITRLTEHSMSQDAREAFGTLTKQVNELRTRYHQSGNWRETFQMAEQSLTTLIGPPPSPGAPAATAPGATRDGKLPGVAGIPLQVRSEFQLLRDQLAQFWTTATGEVPQTSRPATDSSRPGAQSSRGGSSSAPHT